MVASPHVRRVVAWRRHRLRVRPFALAKIVFLYSIIERHWHSTAIVRAGDVVRCSFAWAS